MRRITITHATAGIFLFIGSLQWIIFSTISDSLIQGFFSLMNELNIQISVLFPPFSTVLLSTVMISLSTEIFGIIIIISAFILHYTYRFTLYTLLFSLSGLILILIGIFPKGYGVNGIPLISIWVVITSVSAVFGYFLVKKPVSYFSLLIGIFCLIFLFFSDIFCPVSPLCVPDVVAKQIITYLLLIWISMLGGYFMGYPETFTLKRRRKI